MWQIIFRYLNLVEKLRVNWNTELVRHMCLLGKHSAAYDYSQITNCDRIKKRIRIGEYSHIRGGLMTFPGGEIEIGNYCYLGEGSKIWAEKMVKIGNNVLIAHYVNVFDSQTHPRSSRDRHEHYSKIIQGGFPKIDLGGKPVIIHDDVWVASGAIILQGVTIERGAIIGAGSVVTKDVPAWTIVAGNPARVIREIPENER